MSLSSQSISIHVVTIIVIRWSPWNHVPPLIINSLAISGPPITRALIMAIWTIADGVGGITLSGKDRGDTNHTGDG